MNKQYELYKEPYIRKADYKFYGTNNIMIDFIISLLPIILIGWYQNGVKIFIENKSIGSLFYPIIFILIGGLLTFLIELVYYYFKNINKKNNEFIKITLNSHAMIPGLLLSLILPLQTPIWVLIIGCLFTTIIGKLIFGGFGHNIFNPALVGYIFVMTAFYSVISKNNIDIISSPTPLNDLSNILNGSLSIKDLVEEKGLVNICFGLKYGTIAETSSLACLISFIYLIVRKVIDYRMVLFCLLSFFITSLIIGFFTNDNSLLFAIYNLFNGGIIFGSVFMVTEPVTSPRSVYGKIIYSIFIGITALILRLISDLEDGTSTAILFMNMLSIILDNYGAKIRVEKILIYKIRMLSILFIIYIVFTTYTILKIKTFKIIDEQTNIELINIKQDYNELIENNNIIFEYNIKINNNDLIIKSDINGNILSNLDVTEEEHELIKEFIIKNKINQRSTIKNNHYGYITKISIIENNKYEIISNSRGYYDNVKMIVIIENKNIIDVNVDLSLEKELQGGLDHASGTKQDLINIGKNENSDIVSGVTYTSVAIMSCRKVVLDYMNTILGGNNE